MGLSSLEEACMARDYFKDLIKEPSPLLRVGGAKLDLPFEVLIKDESARLGQKSFKAMGGSFALGAAILRMQGRDIYQAIKSEGLRFADLVRKEGEPVLTFATASDGNHGAGLSWAANALGHKAVVWFPSGVTQSRVDTARGLGAEVRVSKFPYDETVALARKTAFENKWTLVQDTAWEGYTEVPQDIMAAYKLIAHEAVEAMKASQVTPTHVMLQVGVGSFAAAIAQYIRECPYTRDIQMICLEPATSACLMASLKNGKQTTVEGGEFTISVGLDCCNVSDLAWPTLRDETDAHATFLDDVPADGLRVLRREGIVSGESAAATGVGLLRAVQTDPALCQLLRLSSNSKVLVFNTEGMTAPTITEDIMKNTTQPLRPAPATAIEVLRCTHDKQRVKAAL